MTNTGYRNTGDRNTGNRNTGNRNTGYRNTGNRNTGNRNTGNRNTGYRNTGYRNTGNRNTGYRNTGDRNTGYRNTGNRNTGDRNTGNLNTITPTKWYVFNNLVDIFDENGDCIIWFPSRFYFDVKSEEWNDCCIWIPSDSMTKEEKKEYKIHETTGGYVKVSRIETDMKVHWRRAFNKCEDLDDIRKTFDIPWFDYDIFEEISWISKEDFEKKLGNVKEDETIMMKNWKKYKVQILEEVE